MNATFEIWSQIVPERAIACSFNLEYLLVGGRDARSRNAAILHVVRLDGRRLGRPQRQGRFQLHVAVVRRRPGRPAAGGTGASVAGRHHGHASILPDSRRPGPASRRLRRPEGRTLTDAERTVMSYCCDRARAMTWGIKGGLPSLPHGVWLNKGTRQERFLGAVFSNVRSVSRRHLHPPVGGRRRLRRPARARSRLGPRGRHRRLRLRAARAQGLRRRRARDRRGPRRIRGRPRRHRARAGSHPRPSQGWLRGRRTDRQRATCEGELDVLDLVRRMA